LLLAWVRSRKKYSRLKAVASPLLEDINISGAQGILVNITAGLDLSIGELDDVGNTITGMASDDATVVVGTVIDSEMASGELRVTLVATGLGKKQEEVQPVSEVASIKRERRLRKTGSTYCNAYQQESHG